MRSACSYPLSGTVHVDEFYVGGEEEGLSGRSKGAKSLVVVALEIKDKGVGRAYAKVIEDASDDSFRPFFEEHISKDANIVTDEWKGYLPLMDEFTNLTQMKSEKGKNFPDLHIHIMNIKGWLRRIHHHCSKERLQGYLDEHHFRFTKRNNMNTIFDTLIKRMVLTSVHLNLLTIATNP